MASDLLNNVGELEYIFRTDLEAYQGEFKKDRPDLIQKLVGEISTHGFNAPIFIWVNHPSGKPALLDWHQRLKALNALAKSGKKLPEDKVPTIWIRAKNDAEAWQKIVEYNSRYSEIDSSYLVEMIGTYNLDMANIPVEMMPDIELDDLDPTKDPDDEGGGSLKINFQIMVTCESEGDQESAFNHLQELGYNVKLM